jgi:flagellar basal-body rod protein FlgF
MTSSLYVALSGQLATDRRMATIATNVANMSTPGYRAEEVRFETVLSEAGRDDVAFATDGGVYTSLRAGPVTPTGNPLDVAPQGDVWLGMQTPNGVVYTRDGRMTMTPNGELRTMTGFAVVDNGGANIQLNPDGGTVSIAVDGTISQDGAQMGTLGLFEMQPGTGMRRYGNSGVIPDSAPRPVIDFNGRGVRQGFIEGSNVDPVSEMTKLISVQRSFELAANAVQQSEDMTSETIRQLGPSS